MTAGTPEFNGLYHQWDLPGKLTAVVVPLIGLIWWLIRKDDDAIEAACLQIKQAMSTMFMQTVMDEAWRLLALLDEHLPIALSQESAIQPQRSRFDHFCQALRTINLEELEKRVEYTNIIRDAFGGVIVQTIKRLMEAATSSSRTAGGELLNPTGIQFDMEGPIHLKFAFISETSVKMFARQRRYYRLHATALFSFLMAVLCLFLLWFPLFFDQKWAWYGASTMLLLAAIFVPVGLITVVLGYRCQRWLQYKARTYQQKTGLLDEFSKWTNDQ